MDIDIEEVIDRTLVRAVRLSGDLNVDFGLKEYRSDMTKVIAGATSTDEAVAKVNEHLGHIEALIAPHLKGKRKC